MAATAVDPAPAPARPTAPSRPARPMSLDGIGERIYLYIRGSLEQAGDMVVLTAKTIASAITPPYPYGIEFVQQFLFVLRACWFPMLISTIAFGYEAPGLQAANVLTLI